MLKWLILGLLPVAVALSPTFLGGIIETLTGQSQGNPCKAKSFNQHIENNVFNVTAMVNEDQWDEFLGCRTSDMSIHVYDPQFTMNFPKSATPYNVVYFPFWDEGELFGEKRRSYVLDLDRLKLPISCKQNVYAKSEKVTLQILAKYGLAWILDLYKGIYAVSSPTKYYFHPLFKSMRECMDGKSSLAMRFAENTKLCIVPEPLPSLTMLNGCEFVENIVIDRNTKDLDATVTVRTFRRLQIHNSLLTKLPLHSVFHKTSWIKATEYANFLFENKVQASISIQINKKLCVPLNFKDNYFPYAGYWLVQNNANSEGLSTCQLECSSDYAKWNKACNVINENIDIDCAARSMTGPPWQGIGYNKVTLKTKNIALRNCEVAFVNKYFERILNLDECSMIVENAHSGLLEINDELYHPPKTFKLYMDNKAPRLLYAALKHNVENVEFPNGVDEFPEGVCHFRGVAVEVKGCKIIEGDLHLGQNSISVDPMLEEINGCLRIVNASLSNYEFLNNLKSVHDTNCLYHSLQFYKQRVANNLVVAGLPTLRTDVFQTCIPYEYRLNTLPVLQPIMDHRKYEHCGQERCVFLSAVEGDTNCRNIDGDLIVDGKTGKIAPGIKHVRGCINIVNSTRSSYDFLKTIEFFSEDCAYGAKTGIHKTEIGNNSCIPYLERQNIKNKTISDMVADNSNIAGCAECPGANAESLAAGCAVVIGDLIIDKADEAKVKPKIAAVREVFGRIVIKNNDVKKLTFRKLERIHSKDGQKPALEISDNKGLETIELPVLKNISTTAKTKVEIVKNPNWKYSKTLENKLKKLVGACTDKKDSGCRLEEVKKEEKKKEEAEEEGMSGGAIAGIIIAVLLILILAGVGGGVVAFIIIRKKKKSKSGGANPKPGPPGPPGKGKATPAKTPTASASRSNTNVAKGASKPSNTALTSKASTDKLGPSASRSRENVGRTASREGITATKSRETVTPAKSKETVTPAKSKESVTPAKPPANKPPMNKPPVVKASANVKIGLPKPPAVNVKINVKKG